MLAVLAWASVLVFLPSIAYAVCFAQISATTGARISLLPCLGLAVVVVQLEFANRMGFDGWWFALGPPTTATLVAICVIFLRSRDLGRRLRELLTSTTAFVLSLGILSLPWAHVPTDRILGYSQLPDQIQHALFAQWIAAGEPKVDGAGWGWALSEASSGYPRGAHEVVASLIVAVGNSERAYSPTLVILAAFTAYPAAWALRRARVPTGLVILGAAFAAGCYLELGYAMQGFLPSMAATPLILGGLGLLVEAYLRQDRALAAACGMVIGAAADVYSLSIGLYFVVPAALCLSLAGAGAWRRRRSAWRDGVVAVCITTTFAVAIAPYAGGAVKFFRASSASTSAITGGSSVSDLGNLFHPISYETIFGSWISPDYRLAYVPGRRLLSVDFSAGHTRLGIASGAILILFGLSSILWRREAPIVLAMAGPLTAALFVHQTRSPYYTAKAYQVLAVFVVVGGVIGAHRLAGSPQGKPQYRVALGGARGIAALTLIAIWASAAARSDVSEARSASVTSDFIRYDLPGLDRLTSGHHTALVTRPQLFGTSLWSRLALPSAFGSEFKPGTPPTRPMDVDDVTYRSLAGMDAVVEYAVGGLSLPPPPFVRIVDSGMARLYVAAEGVRASSITHPLESGGEIGGHRIPPSGSETISLGNARRIRLGVLDPDDRYLPLVGWAGQHGIWQPWDADPNTLVPTGAGEPLSMELSIAQAGLFQIAAVGRFDNVRLLIDGQTFGVRGGDLDEPTRVTTVRLSSGTHRLVIVPGVAGRISFAKALTLERAVASPPLTKLCVGGRRYDVAPHHPVVLQSTEDKLEIVNCGSASAVLDWWQPF